MIDFDEPIYYLKTKDKKLIAVYRGKANELRRTSKYPKKAIKDDSINSSS